MRRTSVSFVTLARCVGHRCPTERSMAGRSRHAVSAGTELCKRGFLGLTTVCGSERKLLARRRAPLDGVAVQNRVPNASEIGPAALAVNASATCSSKTASMFAGELAMAAHWVHSKGFADSPHL
jgi:hypothetical protein